jgi:Domain of unknown function (DUF4249)
MKKIHKINILVVFILSMLSACVEKIDIDAGKGESQYVVEGMIVYDPLDPNKLVKDTIKITRSIAYLDNGQAPTVSNATVAIIDSSSNPAVLDLCANVGNGKYVPTQIIPKPRGRYYLLIRFAEGDTVVSYSEINRPCYFNKDSIYTTVLNDKSEGRTGPGGPLKSGWGYVEMKIVDSAGLGDSYRIKYYVKRNPVTTNPYFTESGGFTGWTFYNKIKNLVLVSESNSGENSPNAQLPQQANFNFPVARSINVVEEEISKRPAFYPGDSIKVEVYSITRENLFFYVRLKTELTNGTGGGLAGLFATPVANVPSNIFPVGNSKIRVLGWFGASHKITQATKMTDFDFNIK